MSGLNSANTYVFEGNPNGVLPGYAGVDGETPPDFCINKAGTLLYVCTTSSLTPGAPAGWALLVGSSAGISGTVTSVGLSLPNIFGVSGTPVITSGVLSATLAAQLAHYFFAGPSSGASSTPIFRPITVGDLPIATSTSLGIVKPDNTTISVSLTTGILSVIGGASSSASGTVTSVGLFTPPFLTVTGSPVSTSGTLSASLSLQMANFVFAGPASGGNAAPLFRPLQAADLPLATTTSVGAVQVDNTTIKVTTTGIISAVGGGGGTAALVSNIAALRSLSGGSSSPQLYVEGWRTTGDGGQGNFWFNPADSSSADNGGTIIIDSVGHRYYRDVIGDLYSVKWFGAEGNGSNDDTPEIQAAITYVSGLGGGTVFFPVGTYGISATLTINASDVKLKGAGAGGWYSATDISASSLIWTGDSTGTMISITPNTVNGNNLEGCGVTGLLLNPGSGGCAIGVQSLSSCNGTYNLCGREFSEALLYTGCTTTTLLNFYDWQNNDVWLFGENVTNAGSLLVATGESSKSIPGNTSCNRFHNISGNYNNGTPIIVRAGDHNTFYVIRLFKAGGGTGYGLTLSGSMTASTVAYCNQFMNCIFGSGSAYAQGTELYTFPSYGNSIFSWAYENGDPVPTIGTKASLSIGSDLAGPAAMQPNLLAYGADPKGGSAFTPIALAAATGQAIYVPQPLFENLTNQRFATTASYAAITGSAAINWSAFGEGQISTEESGTTYSRGKTFAYVASYPTTTSHYANNGTNGFWNANWSNQALAIEHIIAVGGVPNPGTSASGLGGGATQYEWPMSMPDVCYLTNYGGYYATVTGGVADGHYDRTGIAARFTAVDHFGQGDCFGNTVNVSINNTNPAPYGAYYDWLSWPAGGILNGQVYAFSNQCYLNPFEFDFGDNGYTTSCYGMNLVFGRQNSASTLGARWIGFQLDNATLAAVDSFTAQPLDEGITFLGPFGVGINMAAATFPGIHSTPANCAIALPANAAIYFDASRSDGVTTAPVTTVGPAFVSYSSAFSILSLYNAGIAVEVSTASIFLTGPTWIDTSANDYITITGTAGGGSPNITTIAAQGGDTYIDIAIVPKGVNGVGGGGGVIFGDYTVANCLYSAPSSTGGRPAVLGATGPDTYIDILLTPKGGLGYVAVSGGSLVSGASTPASFSATNIMAIRSGAGGTVYYVACSSVTW